MISMYNLMYSHQEVSIEAAGDSVSCQGSDDEKSKMGEGFREKHPHTSGQDVIGPTTTK